MKITVTDEFDAWVFDEGVPRPPVITIILKEI